MNYSSLTFSLLVAVPSVPVKQLSIEFAFDPEMYLLKQALPLITARQLSLSTSQVESASTEETRTTTTPTGNRMLKLCGYDIKQFDAGVIVVTTSRAILSMSVSEEV